MKSEISMKLLTITDAFLRFVSALCAHISVYVVISCYNKPITLYVVMSKESAYLELRFRSPDGTTRSCTHGFSINSVIILYISFSISTRKKRFDLGENSAERTSSYLIENRSFFRSPSSSGIIPRRSVPVQEDTPKTGHARSRKHTLEGHGSRDRDI